MRLLLTDALVRADSWRDGFPFAALLLLDDEVGQLEVEGRSELDVLAVALHHAHLAAQALHDRCVDGERVAVRLAESLLGQRYVEHLWRPALLPPVNRRVSVTGLTGNAA